MTIMLQLFCCQVSCQPQSLVDQAASLNSDLLVGIATKSANLNAFLLAFVKLNVCSCLLRKLHISLNVNRYHYTPERVYISHQAQSGGGDRSRTGVLPVYYIHFIVYILIIYCYQLCVKYNLTLPVNTLNCYYALDNTIFSIDCLCRSAQFPNL